MEHGVSKRWVLWQRDEQVGMPVVGEGADYAEFEIPAGHKLLCEAADLPNDPAVFEAWVAARKANADSERLFYNWCAPYDWTGGRVGEKRRGKSKAKRNKTSRAETVYVDQKFDPGTLGEPPGALGAVSLVQSKYGIRGRWVIIVPVACKSRGFISYVLFK